MTFGIKIVLSFSYRETEKSKTEKKRKIIQIEVIRKFRRGVREDGSILHPKPMKVEGKF